MLGQTDYARRTVTLAHGLTQAERRCTITHETVHIERGPTHIDHHAREERAVNDLAARRLISVEALAEAMLWSRDDHETADELWVDVDTLRARFAGLTTHETSYVESRLDNAGHA